METPLLGIKHRCSGEQVAFSSTTDATLILKRPEEKKNSQAAGAEDISVLI